MNKEDFDITGREFLQLFYNIKSYENMLNWIEKNKDNKLLSISTKYRVVSYGFMLFNDKHIVINDDIVNTFIEYYTSNGKQVLYDYFSKHISYKSGKYKLNKKLVNNSDKKQNVIKYINNFLTPSVIYDFLDMIKNTYNTLNFEDYEFEPDDFIVKHLFNFILSRIK